MMPRFRAFEQYLLLGCIVFFFFWVTSAVLRPIILGMVFALVVTPLNRKLIQKTGLNDTGASAVTTLFLLICVFLPIVYVGVVVAGETISLIEYLRNLPSAADGSGFSPQAVVDSLYGRLERIIPIARSDFESNLRNFLTSVGTFLAALTASFASSLPVVVLNFFLCIIAVFFSLRDGSKFVKMLRHVLPFEKDDIAAFFATTESISRGAVLGAIISGLVQGLILGVAFVILGLPHALLVGAATSILTFVPLVGIFITGLPGIIYLFAIHRNGAAVALSVAFLLAYGSDNVVKPLMLRGQTSIHPLLGIVSVLGGLAAFGFPGLFLGPLLSALMITALEMLSVKNALENEVGA